MKYLIFFILTVIIGFGLFAINNIVYGFQESKSFYDLYYENELLVKGTIVSSANNPLNEELTGYNVKVLEQYSKASQSFNLITVFDPLNMQSFDVDDTVFLYLNKIDSTYVISPYSFKIPANCEELSFTGLSYLPWQNPPRSSPAGIPLEIVDLQGNPEQLLEVGVRYIIQTGKFWYEPTDQLDLEIIIQNTDKNEIVFQERKTHYGDPCNWKDIKWYLTFDNAGHYTAFIIKHEQLFADKIVRPSIIQTVEFTAGIDDESLSKASMINPSLKEQMNLGIPIDAMYCRNDLMLIQKYNDSPACVTDSTKLKLIERGWTGNIETTNNITGKYSQIPQNDLFCYTNWEATYNGNVYDLANTLNKEFKTTLTDFGNEINPDRNISVKTINQTAVRITVEGMFKMGSEHHDTLTSIINNTSGITELFREPYNICQ